MWTSQTLPGSHRLKPRYGDERGPAVSTWSPSRALAWVELMAAVVIGLAAVPLDGLGRVLTLPAALLVTGLGLRDLLLRPTLSADEGGIHVAVGLHHLAIAWDDLASVRVVTDRRAPLLELDRGDAVYVLTRRRLGSAPYLVLEDLEKLRG